MRSIPLLFSAIVALAWSSAKAQCLNGPAPTAERFISTYYSGDFVAAYSLLTTENRQAVSIEDWTAVTARRFGEDFVGRWKVRLAEVKTDDDHAQALIEANVPHRVLEFMKVRDSVNLAGTLVRYNDDVRRQLELLRIGIATADPRVDDAFARYAFSIKLTKEDGQVWCVDDEEARRIAKARASTQAHDAKVKEKTAQKAALLPKLKITSLEKGVGENFGKNVPGVFGEVKNESDRTLTRVEIRVEFLDADGKAVYEKIWHPVFKDISLSKAAAVLKPNYARSFGFKADDVPSTWSGRVRGVVVDADWE
jgi:hypothetical protein